MKVLLVNGSPHEHGCTAAALSVIADTLRADGVEAEIFWIGNRPIGGCTACKACYTTHRCAFGDGVNEFVDMAQQADGFIFGTPVHYAAPSGSLAGFLDRVYFSAPQGTFRGKPGAAITCARRSGTTCAFDDLNKYFTISEMPVISSCYWNNIHGSQPSDVLQDEEGLRIMKTLGHNMAYWLKCQAAGKAAGIDLPAPEPPAKTNFIR